MTSPSGVARELVTKLSFTFNRSNLDKFEKSIGLFKKGIQTTTSEIASAIGQVVNFFGDLAKAGQSTRNIADSAGIAVSEFVAMRKAAQSLSVPTKTFDKLVGNLAKDINDAKMGFGSFIDLIRKNRGAISAPNQLNDIDNFRTALREISTLTNQLATRQDKLRFLQSAFHIDLDEAGDILRLLDQGIEKFDKLTEANKAFGQSVQDGLPDLDKYAADIGNLTANFETLYNKVLALVVPSLNTAVKDLTEFVASTEKEAEIILKGLQTSYEVIKSHLSAPFDLYDLYFPDKQAGGSPAIAQQTNNLNVQVTVPTGTTQEQALFLSNEMRRSVEEMFESKTREIINNNPQVE